MTVALVMPCTLKQEIKLQIGIAQNLKQEQSKSKTTCSLLTTRKENKKSKTYSEKAFKRFFYSQFDKLSYQQVITNANWITKEFLDKKEQTRSYLLFEQFLI
ncbi:hypothetical protein [Belliella kenyensis]|uniref:hypothetical protein n=1 Tax=Belliella kenyensis TaxID=1472724 RepID=UPI001F4BB48B|nr:hypothetical protein [Belliella kenyensis]